MAPRQRHHRRPPKQRCPGCGGDVYAWGEGTPCRNCAREVQPDRDALGRVFTERFGERPAEQPDPAARLSDDFGY